MKKISLFLIPFLFSLGACSTVGGVAYDQRIVDQAGPEPGWVTSPEKARRIAAENKAHVYIGHAPGKTYVEATNEACRSSQTQADQSGVAVSLGKVYWTRSRGVLGDRFNGYCLLTSDTRLMPLLNSIQVGSPDLSNPSQLEKWQKTLSKN